MVVSIETTLELWALTLRDVKRRMRGLFAQERAAVNAGLFLDGLLGDERRKTGWMRAEVAGDPGPWRQQALLGRDRWDADELRDMVLDYVIEHLADQDAVLVIDETGFLKQGQASCGVARQYTGSAGKITNCQIGVLASYVSRHGHAFVDRALYLPKAWADNPARLQATNVPDEIGFSTKPQLATKMIERAIAAHVPFAWVAADTVYGVGNIETALRRAGKGYVLGVSSTHGFGSWNRERPLGGSAEEIAKALPASDWQRLPAGAGTKGPRLHDWCYLELANLEAEEFNDEKHGLWTRGLLIRRNIADGDLAYFTTWCPAGTSIVIAPRDDLSSRQVITACARWFGRRSRPISIRLLHSSETTGSMYKELLPHAAAYACTAAIRLGMERRSKPTSIRFRANQPARL